MLSSIRIATVIFFLGGAMCLWSLWVASPTSLAHQEQERIIRKQKHPNEPVKITALKTKRGISEIDDRTEIQKFLTDDDDWLKGLIIKINNTSAKSINYVSVRLTFVRPKEETTSGEAPLIHSITYGRNPFQLKDLSLANQYKVPPGGAIDVVLSDKTYEMIKRVLKRLNYPAGIKQIDLLIDVVGFDDGTVWEMGATLRRDPKDANKFIPVEEQMITKRAGPKPPPFSEWGLTRVVAYKVLCGFVSRLG